MKNYDFSFSGLKTAIFYHYKNQPEKTKKSKRYIQELLRKVQQVVIDVLITKSFLATEEFGARAIFLSAGFPLMKNCENSFVKK